MTVNRISISRSHRLKFICLKFLCAHVHKVHILIVRRPLNDLSIIYKKQKFLRLIQSSVALKTFLHLNNPKNLVIDEHSRNTFINNHKFDWKSLVHSHKAIQNQRTHNMEKKILIHTPLQTKHPTRSKETSPSVHSALLYTRSPIIQRTSSGIIEPALKSPTQWHERRKKVRTKGRRWEYQYVIISPNTSFLRIGCHVLRIFPIVTR